MPTVHPLVAAGLPGRDTLQQATYTTIGRAATQVAAWQASPTSHREQPTAEAAAVLALLALDARTMARQLDAWADEFDHALVTLRDDHLCPATSEASHA